MKCIDFSNVLLELDKVALGFQYNASGLGIDQLTALMRAASAMSVAALRKRLDMSEVKVNVSNNNFKELAIYLTNFSRLMNLYGKPAVATDVAEALAIIERADCQDREEFVRGAIAVLKPAKQASASSTIRRDIVSNYVRRLETTLGDDPGFNITINALKSDTSISAQELLEIANIFAFAKVKSKSAAISKIVARHKLLMAGRAKLDATAGRIAG